MTSHILDVYESDFINLFPYQELSFFVILIKREKSFHCPLRPLFPQKQLLLRPADIFFLSSQMILRNAHEIKIKTNKQKNLNHKQKHQQKTLLEKKLLQSR